MKRSCGSVIDVNNLLSEQRMRLKKRIVLLDEKTRVELEKQIVQVRFGIGIQK